jgi:uncharacterized membrane protein
VTEIRSRRQRLGQALDFGSRLRPHVFVTVAALVAGVLLAVVIPPLRGADEPDHIYRAFQLAFGELSTAKHGQYFGAVLPVGLENYMHRLGYAVWQNPNHTAYTNYLLSGSASGHGAFVDEGTIASYGPGAYVVYVPIIRLGLLLQLPIGLLLYLARVAGVTAYALLVGLATKRLPGHKWVLVAVALVPAMLAQAATVSADGLTNALTLLLIAWFFRLCADDRLTKGQTAEICLATIVLGMAKPPYFLFVIPILYAVARNRRSQRLRLVGGVAVVCIPLFLVTTEYQRSHSTRLDLRGLLLSQGSVDNYAYRNIDTTAQTRALLHAPWKLFEIMYTTVKHEGLTFPKQLVGSLVGYQSPGWLAAISLVTIIFAIWIGWSTDKLGRSTWDGVVMVTVTVICAIAICGSVYILANAVGAPRIDGLTPRYFLALIPGLILGVASIHAHSSASIQEVPVTGERTSTTLTNKKAGNVRVAMLCAALTFVFIWSFIGMLHFLYSGPATF